MTVMPQDCWNDAIEAALLARAAKKERRQRRELRVLDATHVEIGACQLVNFASNDYLGLTHHPRVVAAFESTARRGGVGAGAQVLQWQTPRNRACRGCSGAGVIDCPHCANGLDPSLK